MPLPNLERISLFENGPSSDWTAGVRAFFDAGDTRSSDPRRHALVTDEPRDHDDE
jgi:hypothetical protein